MKTLLVEKTRIYGYSGGPAYRASVDGESIACAKRKDDATGEAIHALYSTYAVSTNAPAMARTADGRTFVGTEVNLESFALFTFDAAGKRSISVTMGARSINGVSCTLEQFVRYNALTADGMDCFAAASEALGVVK